MTASARSEGYAHAPATIRLGDLEVQRMGYGAMRLPGKDAWGEPDDPARARSVLRRAVELGINFLDTAWFYGPLVANRLIAEALHPYPRDLVIATKLGGKRLPDKGWAPALRPEELRAGAEDDRRQARRLARPDRARLAARTLARHAADPGHQLGRAPRGELGRPPHRAVARRGDRDRRAGIAAS